MSNLYKSHQNEFAQLIDKYGLTYLAVFGSHARGEARPDSDIDILVDYHQPIGLHGLYQVQESLTEILNQKVDLVSRRAVKPEFFSFISQDLDLIYEQKP